MVFPNATNDLHTHAIASFAREHGLPTMYGGRGASPADLPVDDQVEFEMGLNFKTARALGLAIGVSLQLQADEVIPRRRLPLAG